MQTVEENQEEVVVYARADEVREGDEVLGMMMQDGVMLYLVQRKRNAKERKAEAAG